MSPVLELAILAFGSRGPGGASGFLSLGVSCHGQLVFTRETGNSSGGGSGARQIWIHVLALSLITLELWQNANLFKSGSSSTKWEGHYYLCHRVIMKINLSYKYVFT